MSDTAEQQGNCLTCQECCSYVEYPVTMLSIEVLEYFLFRGENFILDDKNGVLSIRVYKPCVHLTKKGCDIYETRPETCRVFMCSYKDESIKEAKDAACKRSNAFIRQAIEQYREKTNADT